MGSAAGLGVSTFGEGGFWIPGGDGFGITGGMGASARADQVVRRATEATAKVRIQASSPDRLAQSSLFRGPDLHGSEAIQAGHRVTMLGSVSRVKPRSTGVSGVPHNPCRE